MHKKLQIADQIRGPINHDDLSSNWFARKFLTYLSTPLRYAFGMAVGLLIGALYPENLSYYSLVLIVVFAFAVLWMVLSLIAWWLVDSAFDGHIKDGEKIADFELMYSRSWIALIKKKGT